LQRIMNQCSGFEVSVPQISHRYCVTAAMVNLSCSKTDMPLYVASDAIKNS
jgi:hypothetical protein